MLLWVSFVIVFSFNITANSFASLNGKRLLLLQLNTHVINPLLLPWFCVSCCIIARKIERDAQPQDYPLT